MVSNRVKTKQEPAPGVDTETPTRCQHVNAWRLKWKFSWKYQFPMVIAPCKHSTLSTHINNNHNSHRETIWCSISHRNVIKKPQKLPNCHFTNVPVHNCLYTIAINRAPFPTLTLSGSKQTFKVRKTILCPQKSKPLDVW